MGKVGIQKDFSGENLQVRHATYSSNTQKENKRLLNRNSYPVGSPTPTQLTIGETAEPTANGAKALLGKNNKENLADGEDALHSHTDTMSVGALKLTDKQHSS
ncbi:hypothetical protein, partial [Campylobacter fetus]